MKLAPDTIQEYRDRGVVKIENALNDDEVAKLRRAVDHQMGELGVSPTAYDFQNIAEQVWSDEPTIDTGSADRFRHNLFKEIVAADEKARPLFDRKATDAPNGKKGKFFYDAAGWKRFPAIRQVALDSVLPEVSAQLLSSDYLNFWEDNTFVKTPGGTQRTAFHQDYNYFQVTGRKCCIAWAPLDPVDAESGAIEYVIGSHRWGREFAPNMLFSQSTLPEAEAERLPDIEAARDDYEIVCLDAQPGDVIFHDVLTVHGAGGNLTLDRMRRAISFRYCGDDIRYTEKRGAVRQPWVTSKPPEGAALYTKEYPRVWPRPFPGAELSRLY